MPDPSSPILPPVPPSVPPAPAAAPEQQEVSDVTRTWIIADWILKGLAVAIIPLFVWAMSLHDSVILLQEEQEDHQKALETREKNAEELEAEQKDLLQQISDLKVTIGQLEVKLDTANTSLSEIKIMVANRSGNRTDP